METNLLDSDAETPLLAPPPKARPVTPAPGEAIEVSPGVLWMRLPLPFALDHINVYAIADDEGWAIVDAGLASKASRAGWETALAGPLGGRPVTRVIATHMHPDHIGLVGWLCRRFDAPLSMSRLEYVTARMLLADTGRPAPDAHADYYRACGWTDAQIEGWRESYGRFGRAVEDFPPTYHRLTDGDRIPIGGQDWRVVVGSGHSPEHVCLWREADDVFLAGDQVLPRISSNVSVWPTEPDADPLEDWLSSLRKLKAVLPARMLVLPAHGEPFHDLHKRLDALIVGHEKSLNRLARRLAEPMRAVDTFRVLFARPVDDGVLGMATGEAMANLNHLARQGRAVRRTDKDKVDWWSTTGGETT
ncbi:MBL fold metallo-hydrolase [Brevundimonas sp. Leaf363]|uniref:MBL fold metallo-hydrolase n=1 Tax=Brevundimonas sp. Leaf363 TaxID=1736353 RepID=UPI0006F33364|nr:MBL fold metallo-hydrolase [Brevundimonas sp. Leaf363]KQS55697.1 MBL fold metallo-hydrolase [Brevundimonas sp. Leaf363]